MTAFWPERHYPQEPMNPARRENYRLRAAIDDVMQFVKFPQKMSTDLARVALVELGAPRPVIDRLLNFVEYRP